MTQQLNYDFTQAPLRNPDYFYPLALVLDPVEKANFIATGLVPHINYASKANVICSYESEFLAAAAICFSRSIFRSI